MIISSEQVFWIKDMERPLLHQRDYEPIVLRIFAWTALHTSDRCLGLHPVPRCPRLSTHVQAQYEGKWYHGVSATRCRHLQHPHLRVVQGKISHAE